MGWGKTLTFLPFGERWHMHRKVLQTSFSNTNVRKWHKLQVTEARRTVGKILGRPEGWETSLRRLAVAIVLQVSYGADVPDDDDPYIQIANDAMFATGNGGAPANSIVDLVPPGKHVTETTHRFNCCFLIDSDARSSTPPRLAHSRLGASVCAQVALGD